MVDKPNVYDDQAKRYVIVRYVTDGDYYTLLNTNQGRFHFDYSTEALSAAEAYRAPLKEKLGIEPHHIKVLHTECWSHGDCCRTVFDPELVAECVVTQ